MYVFSAKTVVSTIWHPIFTLNISDTVVGELEGESCCFYVITVKRGRQQRNVKRRYSEFYDFNRLLIRISTHARRYR
eukprot:UN14056